MLQSTNTFYDCNNLKSVTIPDSVEIICSEAFTNCSLLKNITVPETVTVLEDKFFGYNHSWIGYSFNKDVTITGYKGSSAETYANENSIPFIDIEETTATSATTTVTTTTGEISTLVGDANEDGTVDIADATAIIQHIGNKDRYALSAQGELNADCYNTGDGITGMDAIAIQNLEAKIIDSLPYIE